MSADPQQLHLNLLPLYLRAVQQLHTEGYFCYATTTYRTPATENALSPDVTSATGKTSKHCFSLAGKPAAKAFDMSFFRSDGKYIADGAYTGYKRLGELWHEYAKEFPALKLVWGGDWKDPYDPGHCQIA